MRHLNFPLTREVVETALGYAIELDGRDAPDLCFELAPELRDLGAVPIAKADQDQVATQIRDVFAWCAARFPIGVQDVQQGPVSAISAVFVGRGAHEGEFLTASSPHRPYHVFVAAPWPLRSEFRLASLLAHEAMHQALYNRERLAAATRRGALAYSPWKCQLRPGRLVWHAFWTFAAQFVFLGEATLRDATAMLAADRSLPEFLAEMEIRIECCDQSLAQFEVLRRPEAGRVAEGLATVRQVGAWLQEQAAGYASSRETWSRCVAEEIKAWSDGTFPQPASAEPRGG